MELASVAELAFVSLASVAELAKSFANQMIHPRKPYAASATNRYPSKAYAASATNPKRVYFVFTAVAACSKVLAHVLKYLLRIERTVDHSNSETGRDDGTSEFLTMGTGEFRLLAIADGDSR